MSIWIKNKLAPYSYKKTLLAKNISLSEKLLIWLEGVDQKFSFNLQSNCFGICGGEIGTNAGVYFSKEQLQEIVDSMPEGATLRVAACNHIGNVEADFKKDNDMIQVGDNSFAPSNLPNVKELAAKYNER